MRKLITALMMAASVAPASAGAYDVGHTVVYRGPLPQFAWSSIRDTYDGWLDTMRSGVGGGIPLSDSRSYIYVMTMAHQRLVDRVNSFQQPGRFCQLMKTNVEYIVTAKMFSQGMKGPPTDTPTQWSSNSSFYVCLKPKAAEDSTWTACLWAYVIEFGR